MTSATERAPPALIVAEAVDEASQVGNEIAILALEKSVGWKECQS